MNQCGLKQSGIALVVGLIIMFVLTILAVSGAADNMLENRMVNNMQTKVTAFQAAETGLDQSMRQSNILVKAVNSADKIINQSIVIDHASNAETEIEYTGKTPALGFSIKKDAGFISHNFSFKSTGRSDQNKAISEHEITVSRIGPGV